MPGPSAAIFCWCGGHDVPLATLATRGLQWETVLYYFLQASGFMMARHREPSTVPEGMAVLLDRHGLKDMNVQWQGAAHLLELN